MGLFTNQNDLKNVFGLSKIIGKLSLSKVLEASCGCKVIPINLNDPKDALLIKHLISALNKFISLTKKTGQRFRGNRINDIGKNIEALIESEIRKTPLEINRLGKTGYPDFEIKQNGRITYLELKITGNINKQTTHHRMFYLTSGKKVKNDARHLLLLIQMEEEESKYWKIMTWQIRDISNLKLGLKTEFNSNFQDLDKTYLLTSG